MKCRLVFKYVSAKMQETGAIIGGESSGGPTVHGHINGKDGIYAAALLIEMLAVTGKSFRRSWMIFTQNVVRSIWKSVDYKFTLEKKLKMQEVLMEQKQLAGSAGRDRPCLLSGWQQGLLQKWRLGHRPLLRHGAAAAHFLRDAGCRRGGGHLHQIRAVPLTCRAQKRHISHSIPCLATLLTNPPGNVRQAQTMSGLSSASNRIASQTI